MPRIGKNTPTNNSSEMISNADSDSESSSISESSDGSGDEGITILGNNKDVTNATALRGATLPANSSPLKILIGSFCALTAVGGGALLIYGGNELNDPKDSQRLMHQMMLLAGGIMLGVGSIAAGFSVHKPATPS
jgi:hypothetical protein